MYPTSAAFKAALKRSHEIRSRVDVFDSGSFVRTLYPDAGQVNASSEAIRRRFTMHMVDTAGDLAPSSPSSLLAPYGNEMRPYRGVILGDEIEWIPLGVFGISDVSVNDSGANIGITVEGFDRARKVQRARFTAPYIVTADANYSTAIKDLINSRVPGLTYNFMLTTSTTPRLVFDEMSDPWEAAQKMANSIGADLFFDVNGVCVLRPVLDPTTAPLDWTYAEGAEATIMYIDKGLSDEKTYNHVVVTGENSSGDPVRGEAKDTNPLSPTYYLGDYGDVPTFYKSTFITTVGQANAAAAGWLQKVLGTLESINFTAIVNPAHEVDDIIEIKRARAHVNARYQLTSFNINLKATQAMNATVRKRTV